MIRNLNASVHSMLKEKIKMQKIGTPIIVKDFQHQIATAIGMEEKQVKNSVAVGMRLALKDKEFKLKRFQKGVYYRYCEGAFGDSVIDKETLIYKRYIDNFSGYETGPKLLLGLGLTTHLSNLPRKFVSNAALKRSFKDKILNINIVKPRVSLNKGNLRYFQLLDTILMVKTIPVDAQDPIEIYLKYIKTYRLTLARAIFFVVRYYRRNKFLLSVLAGIQERCNTNAIAQK